MTMFAAPILGKPPFDSARLDALMDAAGLDAIVATSRHNIQYLLGGYRFFFYESMEAIGTSRYLPMLIYPKGRPGEAAYIGCAMENFERELERFWMTDLDLGAVGTVTAAERAAKHILRLGGIRRVGVEAPFLPADAAAALRHNLANIDIADAVIPLERLRAIKRPEEIEALRQASERVVAAMGAVFASSCRPGMTKADVAEALRREEVAAGLTFDYCLITAGQSLNRAPSAQKLAQGDIVSLDSGGNFRGYIGDLCRMGIIGEADAELRDLLSAVDDIQQSARKSIAPGRLGREILAAGAAALAHSPIRANTHFTAHGMGLVSHEAPRLVDYPGLSYKGEDGARPLEAGMVVSVETTLAHPRRGFIKLEDTVLVTAGGCEGLGDGLRGWNRAG